MSKVTDFIKNEILNRLKSVDYCKAKKELFGVCWEFRNDFLDGIEIGSLSERKLYEEQAHELLEDFRKSEMQSMKKVGVHIDASHKVSVLDEYSFFVNCLDIDPLSLTFVERYEMKQKEAFFRGKNLKRYMLEHFNAQELSDALAILLDSQEFEDFANDLINECEAEFFKQCIDFALEKMSDKILEGTSLDFQEAVTSWVTERLNKSGSFVSLEIPYYLTESGCNETIEFNPKQLLN